VRPPRERFCTVGDVRLCHETFGSPDDPAVLLVMGLGAQMLGWHEDLCESLAAGGRFVIRFDNRDSGRSTHFDAHPAPTPARLLTRRLRPLAYTLDDMAADAAGLLDELGIARADVIGASMGGMIAQQLAVNHPERVRSLVSVMANTGSLRSGQPAARLWPHLVRRLPADREGYVRELMATFRRIGSPGFEHDEPWLRRMLELSYERGASADGMARQLAAILGAGDRRRALAGITAPTVVIHGSADRLVAPSGGRATARAIPDAKLILIEGMGHDLPREVWPRIVAALPSPTTLGTNTEGPLARALG
jgi:pimeloyl-ACP methyl ester carboxylesterase